MYYFTEDYLMHHGILGQKWGIRRFQNPDGTRTSAGKRRERQAADPERKEKVKKGLKVGAAVAGGAAVAAGSVAGAVAYSKSGSKHASWSPAPTPAAAPKGVKDYNDAELQNIVKRQNLEKQYKKNTEDHTSQDVLNSANQINNSSSNIMNNVNQIAKATKKTPPKPDYSNLSDEELRRRINRLQMEKQYSQLSAESINQGKSTVDKVMAVAGGAIGIATSAATIALAIHEIVKKV